MWLFCAVNFITDAVIFVTGRFLNKNCCILVFFVMFFTRLMKNIQVGGI